LILILFDAMTDEEIDFTNNIFSETNVKMYNMSFNILRNRLDAEEAVAQTFLAIMDSADKIYTLSYEQIEPYCFIILKNEIVKMIRKRTQITHMKNGDYFNHRDGDHTIEEEYLKIVNQEKLSSCLNNIRYQPLSVEQIKQLARKISLLPLEYRNILFLGYCFNSTPHEIDTTLEIENSISKLIYVQKALCGFMGLENSRIHHDCMKSACQKAIIEETKDYENIEPLHKPNYSKELKHTQQAG